MVLGAALGLLVGACYLGALLLVRSGPFRRALHHRIVASLVTRFPTARLEGEVSVDGLFRPVVNRIVLPSAGDGRPLLVVDRLILQPSLWNLAQGRAVVGKFILVGVHVHGGARGERLGDLVRTLRPRLTEAGGGASRTRITATPRVVFYGLDLRVEGPLVDSQGPIWGPVDGRLQIRHEGRRMQAALATRGPGGAKGTAEVEWGGEPASVRAQVQGLGADSLPAGLRARLPVQIQAGAVDVSMVAPRIEAQGRSEGHVTVEARNVVLFGRRLHSEPVGPLSLHAAGCLRWDSAARALDLVEGKVALDPAGRVGLNVSLSVAAPSEPRFEFSLQAQDLDWAALVAALPPPLAPPPGIPGIAGQLGGRLRVSGPLHRRDEWQLEGALDASRLVATGAGGEPDLTRPFVYQARLARGGTRPVVLGPGNPGFLSLGDLPTFLVRAVLESEDAGFFGHHGFDLAEIQDALAQGGRLRGASTITQQLAKNLYLSRDRTLSRKVREAFATLALEAALSKHRILELYLNLAEWGDGVNGIGEAARHWFGKDVRELSPKQAAFLATVIPNPVRYEMYRRRGALTPAWEARVADLLEKLHTTGVLDDNGLRAAMAETLTFTPGLDGAPEQDSEPDEDDET